MIRLNTWRSVCALAIGLIASGSSVLGAQHLEEAARRAAGQRLRPGDRIELQFRRDKELNSSISVNEGGQAVFPKLGTLLVGAFSIGGLPDTLRARYSEYLRAPELEVTVLRRVVVNGEVRQPGVYMVDVASGVRDAIARAGGLLPETASRRSVTLIRDGVRTKVKNWDRSQGPETDLQSGDQIVVGRKNWLVLNALPVISTSVIVIGLIQSLRQ